MNSSKIRQGSVRLLLSFFMSAALLLAVIAPDSAPPAGQPASGCYRLFLTIDGGIGELPAATPPNCGDAYRAGTEVTLTAQPGADSHVYAWRGTNNDSSTGNSNTVTMNGPKEVGIHYVWEGENQPVGPGTPGGVATVPDDVLEIVHGSDTRRRVTNTTRVPYQRNAQLLVNFPYGSGTCTGWFVAPDTVMTSGHCVYNSSAGGWASGITVVPGRNGTGSSSEPFGRQASNEFWTVTNWINSGLPDYDYAAVILPNGRLGNQVGWYRYGDFSDSFLESRTVTVSGYPGDKPSGTQWRDSDPVAYTTDTRVYYDIDTYGGQSGSAVYFNWGGERYAVAVHGYGGSTYNYGPRITEDVVDFMRFAGASTDLPRPSLRYPSNTTVTTNRPTYTWNEVFGATSYQLRVTGPSGRIINTWYDVGDEVTCSSTGRCSVRPTQTLVHRADYLWRVRARNADDTSPWSSGKSFDVNLAPPAPTLRSPHGTITSDRPPYRWEQVHGARRYMLRVTGPSGRIINAWYRVGTDVTCSGGICQVRPNIHLADGNYTWRVRVRNRYRGGPWSRSMSFTVQ
jgi:glutamyl endopeptidase